MTHSSPTSPHWTEFDRRHIWHPYTQMLTAPAPLPIVRAEGVYLCTDDGRKILDGISSWWVNVHGHNHPRLNSALTRQAEQMAQVIFAGMTHEPAARLAANLVAIAPGSMQRVFFSDDGSTAVEVALKMAYQSWRQRGENDRNLFVAVEHAYHGDTFGAMAAGGVDVFHREFSDLFFEVLHARGPSGGGTGGTESQTHATSSAPTLEAILHAHADRIAAIIIEPMLQGAGGMIIWPKEYLRDVATLAREHGIPLIADEIFTGFGRTGKMFACEHGPIEPDIVCLSKGLTGGYLPMSVTLVTEEIYSTFLSEDRSRTFFHGHSFTGNALGCALALESLEIFAAEGTLERIHRLEALFSDRLSRLRRLEVVASTRGIGALAVIELQAHREGGYLDSSGPELAAEFLRRGILLRPLGNVLYFLPPYAITDTEAHGVFDTIEDVLERWLPRRR